MMRRKFLLLALFGLLLWFFLDSGRLLVLDRPERAEAIVVLDGSSIDQRYAKGLEMLRAGYGNRLFLDARSDYTSYGRTPAQYASDWVKQSAGDQLSRVSVCDIQSNSTRQETADVTQCLDSVGARSALIVTSDHHTRRALSIFRKLKPQYRWSIAAAANPAEFGEKWWSHREWAKTWLTEWERMLWWQLVDRWREAPTQ
ncbi:MAG TPA: YdcF family protein [Terriglobales bacterium]|nr:YdcF family protein [Terriglobales bacterium]